MFVQLGSSYFLALIAGTSHPLMLLTDLGLPATSLASLDELSSIPFDK